MPEDPSVPPVAVVGDPTATPPPTGNESPFQNEAEPAQAAPVEQSAAAEPAPNSSPMTGSELPAPASTAEAAPAPEVPSEPGAVEPGPETLPPAASEGPAPTITAPTVQRPLPGGSFGQNGQPLDVRTPSAKRAVYVDVNGVDHQVEVVAERRDGSVDIMIPGDICGHRRDGVRRKVEADQTGDFIK